jgi:fermentation-respiration switch protein FrsA (DUF1100 family)
VSRDRRRGRLRRVLVALALVAAFLYTAAIVRLMLQETELIFRTRDARADTRPNFPYEQVDLPRADSARQFAWVMRQDPQGLWVLFLHGNASTVASRMNVAHYRRLRDLGVSILAPEYRGYNGLDGIPSEASVHADARAAYDYLRQRERIPPDRLVIFGWSLGGAIAVDLAAQKDVEARAVILEGAPASIVDIGQQRYPMFPIRFIIRNPFNAVRNVARVRAPMLFLHSPEDLIVPFSEGRRLFDAAQAPKKLVEVKGGHIEASEIDRVVFYGAVREFLALSGNRTFAP